jgi:Tol biopolymer transport system component
MTAFDRFEARLPELMADLAAPRVPDYVDDMLAQAGRTRQKPAWASLERWLPVDITAQTSAVRGRVPSLRPVVLFVILALAVVGGALLYAGTQQRKLPPPFGPAANGTVLIGTADGDIASFDPQTGATRTVIGGPTDDAGPWFSHDGQRFVFVRRSGVLENLMVADADGSNVRELGPVGRGDAWWEWSPTDDRLVVSNLEPGRPSVLTLIDVATGSRTSLDVGIPVSRPGWRPGHDQLAFASWHEGSNGVYLVNLDGSGLQKIATAATSIPGVALSPDGSKLTYATWDDGTGPGERIHVVDIETGDDRIITPDPNDGYLWQNPEFMPDGTSVVADRFTPGGGPFRIAVIPADGSGPPVALGPEKSITSGGSDGVVAPDGRSFLVQYRSGDTTERKVYVVDAATGASRELPAGIDGSTWQRLAIDD